MVASVTRKQFLIGSGAVLGAALAAPALALAARPTTIKLGLDQFPDSPITKHAMAVADRLKKDTHGEVVLQVFPSNQLGNDSHMLTEVRSGAIQMMGIGDNIFAVLVPNAAIDNIGFAFKDAKTAWAALDGEVGNVVRADIAKHGLHPMTAIWDEGFREITTSTKPIKTVEDLAGFKIRVPESPISLSLFKDLGAAPVTMNSAELYTALQTHVVDGQENPLSTIETSKYYEVQKYCSLTNHMWVGYWMVMNETFWKGLPKDHQKAVATAFDAEAHKERAANEALDGALQATLTKQGFIFNEVDIAPFRAKLVKSGFYDEWHKKFGSHLWSMLEKYTGSLG